MNRRVSEGPLSHAAGYTMVEAAIVMMVFTLVAGFSLVNITGILPGMRANAALRQTIAEFREGRELAIAQRRNIELRFVGSDEIQLIRQDIPHGTTVLSTLDLEYHMEFRLFDDVPDTPDRFGNESAVDFGGAAILMFLSDGTLVDAAGNPVEGSVFLGLADHPETARAVTILGGTGRVRGYRWTGNAWIQ